MPRLCRCGAIVEGRCTKCNPQQHARTTTQRGYDHAWRKLSERKRAIDPLCEHCLSLGRTTAATEVHHMQSIADAPHLRLAMGNLLSVCSDCHAILEGRSAAKSRFR